jgi:hypothetical protein
VWVSRTVRDLVVGSGIELQRRGAHRLKGVQEPWDLFSVINTNAVHVPASARFPSLRFTDRIVLAAAQRTPGLVRALSRSQAV